MDEQENGLEIILKRFSESASEDSVEEIPTEIPKKLEENSNEDIQIEYVEDDNEKILSNFKEKNEEKIANSTSNEPSVESSDEEDAFPIEIPNDTLENYSRKIPEEVLEDKPKKTSKKSTKKSTLDSNIINDEEAKESSVENDEVVEEVMEETTEEVTEEVSNDDSNEVVENSVDESIEEASQEVKKEDVEEKNIQMDFLEYMPITPKEKEDVQITMDSILYSDNSTDTQSDDSSSNPKKEPSKYIQMDILRPKNNDRRKWKNKKLSKDKLHLFIDITGNFAKAGNDYIVVTGLLTRDRPEIENRCLVASDYMSSLLDPSYMQQYNEKKQAQKFGNIFRMLGTCRYTNGISLIIQQSDLTAKIHNPKIYKYYFISKIIDLLIENQRLSMNIWKMVYIYLNEKDFTTEEKVSLMYYLKIRQRLEKERPLKFTILNQNPQIHPSQRAVQVMSKAIYLPAATENRDHIYHNRYKVPAGYIIEYYKHE